jgi:hypothetical protein
MGGRARVLASVGPSTSRTAPRLADDKPLDDVAVSYVFDEPCCRRAASARVRSPTHTRGPREARSLGGRRQRGRERRVNAGIGMGGERDVVSFPGGDVITIPRHQRERGADVTSTTRRA